MTSTERHEARYQRRKARRHAKRRAFYDKYDDYDRASSVSALIAANWEARKGVMWKASVARFNTRYFKNARKQHAALMCGKDTRQDFYHFQIVERGKPRDVHSLHYNERVIRRSVCTNAMVPILSHDLIFDNGASLKGKGVSHSLGRCEKHLHEYWRKYRDNEGYVLVIDYRKFFDNIQHDPLFEIYDKHFVDSRLNTICKNFVRATGESGLYIGPEDSQISAIAYPNRIDHLIKDVWRLPYYNRYMDDSYIIFRDKQDALKYRSKLMLEYAKDGIIANPKKTQIVRLSRGFTYLKTQFFLMPNGRVLKKPCHTSVVVERRKLKAFRRFVDAGMMTLDQVNSSYMSWRGSLNGKAAHKTIHSMDLLFYHLFGTKPWVKKRKRRKEKINHEHGHQYHPGGYSGGNYGAQIVAC